MNFIKKSLIELKKVIWPEQASAFKILVALIIIVILVATFIFIIDITLTWIKSTGISNLKTWLTTLMQS